MPWWPLRARRRLPVLLQSEVAECGLACLAMVAAYWGHDTDVAALRRRFSISLKGSTLKGLIDIARALGMKARPVRLELDELHRVPRPSILHWDMRHFVVVEWVGGGFVVVHDPAVGRRKLTLAQVSTHWTGVALELTPGPGFDPCQDSTSPAWRSLTGHIVGLRRGLTQMLVLALALQAVALLVPFYLQGVVDHALSQGDRDRVMVLGAGFLTLCFVQAALSAARSWVTTTLSTNVNFQWLGNAFTHLLNLPLSYFEKRHLGDIVSRFGSIQTIQHSLTTQFVEGVVDGLLVVATLIAMLSYGARLAIPAAAAVLVYVLVRGALLRPTRDATAEQMLHTARQQTLFIESTCGVQAIRLFGRAEERRVRWTNALADQFNAELRVARFTVASQTTRSLLFAVVRVAFVWIAALAVLDGRMTIGMLFAYLSYQDQFVERLAALADKLFELRLLRLHAERVADIVCAEAEDPGIVVGAPDLPEAPQIELRDVSYRYADEDPFVLLDVDLVVQAGQCVALAGASGCGKTTLIKLLLGLLRPTRGQILVGGVPIDQLGPARHRQMLGAVLQDDLLFSGSIAENISFFEAGADRSHIEHCARMAAIDREIAAMPMGYDTLVGDLGAGVSGGQKQRILLARALYKRPSILILDEATSQLDVTNEQCVNAAVRQMALTRVMAAHRPETIAMAERVIVLGQGRILRDFAQAEPQHHRLHPAGGVADQPARCSRISSLCRRS